MFTRAMLQCPKCRYDVAPSLDAGFRVCPECGEPVSEELCDRSVENLPIGVRRMVYATWLLPIVPGAAAMDLDHHAPLWLDAAAGWLLLLSIAAVYGGWWWVEHWEQPAGAAWRAVGTTLGTLVLDYLAAIVVALAWIGLTR